MEIEEVLPLEKEPNQAEELAQKIPTMQAADIQPASYVSPPKRWHFFRERYDKFWGYRSEINELFDRLFPERETLVMYHYDSGFSGHVFIKRPSKQHPYHVLFTAGMSHVPMKIPQSLKSRRSTLERAELIMFLSPKFFQKIVLDRVPSCSTLKIQLAHLVPWKDNWFTKLNQRYYRIRSGGYPFGIPGVDENDLWPIAWLEKLARLPYKNHTWIHHGSMARDVGSVNTWQASGIFLNFGQLAARNGQTINLYSCVPLYPEEVEYLQQQPLDGTEQQVARERFLRDLPLVIDLKRPPLCSPEAESKL